MQVIVTEVTDENRKALVDLALSCYVGEHCKYCDRVFDTIESLNEAVYAGYHDKGRVACKSCFDSANQENT